MAEGEQQALTTTVDFWRVDRQVGPVARTNSRSEIVEIPFTPKFCAVRGAPPRPPGRSISGGFRISTRGPPSQSALSTTVATRMKLC